MLALYFTIAKRPSILEDFYFFFKIPLFIFGDRGEGRKKERETLMHERQHQSVASRTPLTGNLAHNPGMCPDWELNQRPFSLQVSAQSTEPH